MIFDVYSLFPEVFTPYLNASILHKAASRGLITVHLHNIRDFATDKHKMTDDEPYGGGGGMVMKPEPLFRALEQTLGIPPSSPIILLTPQGERFSQRMAAEIAAEDRVALICGRYEGIDERVRVHLVDREISIGDYVLTGGELPALIVLDAVSRLIPGVLGDPTGAADDSHASGLLEYPHYTRPRSFRGWDVPEILLSGNHGRIRLWRREQALLRTLVRRPDLLEAAEITAQERAWLDHAKEETDE